MTTGSQRDTAPAPPAAPQPATENRWREAYEKLRAYCYSQGWDVSMRHLWDGAAPQTPAEPVARDSVIVHSRDPDNRLRQVRVINAARGEDGTVGVVVEAATVYANVLQTAINHEREPHCCGCFNIRLAGMQTVEAVCNECGHTVDLSPHSAGPAPDSVAATEAGPLGTGR